MRSLPQAQTGSSQEGGMGGWQSRGLCKVLKSGYSQPESERHLRAKQDIDPEYSVGEGETDDEGT